MFSILNKVFGNTTQALSTVRQEKQRPVMGIPPKKNQVSGRYTEVLLSLLERPFQAGARGISMRQPTNRIVNTREGRIQQFTVTAQSAPTCLLPTKFAGDLGKDFYLLIVEAVSNKSYTSFQNRITSYKLYEYFCDNKNYPTSAASSFQGYTEDEFRMLSKDWLMIYPTEKSLGKHLSNSVSFNSPSHKYLLSLLGLNDSNAKDWHLEIFQDHCFLNVHTFEVFSNRTLRVTYEIPLAINTTQNYTTTSLAFDTYNLFNLDIVSVSIVVEYEVDNKGNYIKNGGKLITLFVHDLPYRWDEILTLRNPSPNVNP